ncbi:MAG: DUF342 domain-containing protein [Lachnospiraceae bacterium]|nr:DUF342 domain-containing protein [Lachnospiraceae bacterium]
MTSAEREKFLNTGFTKEQIQEIDEGLQAGLNVSAYANKDFLPIQMRQIRLGLLDKLPVEFYASLKYDWFQMEEIRKGLKAGVDIKIFAYPEIPYEKMRQIRKGLEGGINLSSYLKLDAGIIRELRKARNAGINITKYVNEGYDAQQLYEIRLAIEKGVDLDPYLCKEYRAASIAQICKGLEEGLDVSIYAYIHYSWQQMREIRRGLEEQVDVSKYSSRLYSWDQMHEIRRGLENGLDVEDYRRLRFTAGEMRKKRLAMLADDIVLENLLLESRVQSEDLKFEFSADNMEAFITILTEGKDITKADLLRVLEENHICKGILEDAVDRIVKGKYGEDAILIAKGQEPEKGEDGWYEFFFRTNVEKKPKVLQDGSVDYQNIEWFEMVKEGQKLAYYHAALEGIDGYTVAGEVIKARKGSEQRVLTGQGFKLEADRKTYIATLDGMIRLEDNEMKVTSHMVLDEVTMATGNIKFNGSIHILGDVGYGTVVMATDDIVVDGNVEAATLESGGSIVLKKGMNSAGHGLVNAKKDVVSRFFESAKVIAKGNIEVDKCLNSQLYADGKIISARVLAGGVAQAERGFRLNHVGNHAGLHTVLKLKINEQVWAEYKRLKAAIREAKHELEMLKKSYEEFRTKFPPEVRNSQPIFIKLEKAVFTKRKQLEQLLSLEQESEQSVKVIKEAKIIIAGQAHEGTVLEMDGCRWVAENQHNITIRKHQDQMEVVNN